MKRFRKPISLLLAVLILLSSVMVLSAVNIFAADSITYTFSSNKAGFAQGKITLNCGSGNYDLYWADNSKALTGYRKIATVSGQGSFDMPKYTAIPDAATKLIAVKSGSTTLTVSGAAGVYSIPSSKQFNSKLLYTFGSISDPQIANQGTSSYPNDETHLRAALETLAKRAVDFTIVSGDVVNDQNNGSYASEYKTYQRILADSSYSAPIYEANGNHDVGTAWDKNGNHYNYNAPFIKATGLDNKKATIDAGKPYFEITEPTTGDHFIFMALEGGFYTNKGPQFSTAQLDWLEGLLKKYNNDGKNIFIIEHANIGGWGSGDKLTTPYYYDLALVKSNSDVSRFVKLMETYKDCVIITGHTHLQLEAKDSWVGQYNYSDNNGTSAVMIHNSAIGGVRRLINGSVNRDAVLGLSEGYIVEVYENAILFNGANMYDNTIMPQCSYIVPMTTSLRPEGEIPEDDYDDPVIPTIPASDDITITLKDETNEGWMKNNASEREIQLIDNATGKKYIMTSSDGYKTWTVEVPRSVTDITFKRVRMSDNVTRNQWNAGQRNKSVEWCVQDQVEEVTGIGYWNKSATEPPKPVVTQPATKPTTKPVVTEPEETTAPTKPVVTEPKETTAPTKPVVTVPVTKPTEPKETTKATEPVVTVPVATTVVTIPATSTEATEPVKDLLAPVVIVEQLKNGNIKVSAYPADGNYDCQYQFKINGSVYQSYSDKSTFVCNMPFDSTYSVSVSLKYSDGTEHHETVVFDVVNGEAQLPEMPEVPTKPAEPEKTDATEITTSVITTTVTEATTTAPDYTYFYGDADLNEKINVKDATLVQKYTAKMLTLEGVAFVQSDVTGDGKVNIKDATAIQKYVAKIITVFPVEDATAELASVGAGTTAKQDLETYYTYSSYNQYMALKRANQKNADQSEITKRQNALYSIVGAGGSGGNDTPTPTAKTITVYFENSKNWSVVKIYAWGTAGSNAEWSGVAMTKESDGKYSYTFNYGDYQSIIFNNGSQQTVDISHPGTDKLVYKISGESGGKLTVTC